MILLYACSTQRDTAANRRLQNLSARYNYLYNANVLLTEYEHNLAQTHKDSYEQLLGTYIAPAALDHLDAITERPELADIELKAKTIISEKNFSNYIDEAYLLLGKTNFYKGNYYNAAEYFEYVERAFKENKQSYLNALNWKARTYIQLHNEKVAIRSLDSVLVTLDSVKHHKGESLATLAQMSIIQQDYQKASDYLEKAIKESRNRLNRIRWSYILGQLYEYERNYRASLKNYNKVERSNAPFEMYFNARLSKIRIKNLINPQQYDRKLELLKLTKDDKNLDYADQIYYELAKDYEQESDYKKAEAYYLLSIQESTINPDQKGLSYLQLADLNFKELNNYTIAKRYYDSAILALPKTYPTYEQIVKKSQNLTYLSSRYDIIKSQDTLQLIGTIPKHESQQKQLAKSAELTINAYFEIASFYQQILFDQKEAVKIYETLLARFPKNNYLQAIYYSLYLGYVEIDQSKSAYYKKLVLDNYPTSSYARTILDPSYHANQGALDAEINTNYNKVFADYEKRDFAAVIKGVDEANQRFPGNKLQIQYDYLKAISIGKTASLDSLLNAFQKITAQYPTDSLITPLINTHVNYLNSNLNEFKARKIALLDFDENEQKFVVTNPIPEPSKPIQQQEVTISTNQPPITLPIHKQVTKDSAIIVSKPIKTDGLFTTAESATYYFVVNVSSLDLSLSSSRFGIGQFNRGNYAGRNLKHQLIDLPENQLIYIGNFDNLIEVSKYTEEITKQLPKIMKVPANIYNSFFISKQNFDKIKDSATLNSYLEFFKLNY
jgi:tetratricopeptide (TPR) repeat protein